MDPENDQDLAGNEELGSEAQSQESEEPNDNPAWNDALNAVPQEFHPHLKGHFSTWDKHTQEVQQKFAPFKEFAEQGVSKDDIAQSLTFANLLNTNPRGVFDWLNSQYNYIPAPNANESQGDPANEGVDPDDPFANNPRFQEIAQKAELADAAVRQMQQAELARQAENQVQQEILSIKTDFPNVDPREVITRALGKQSAGITKDIDLQSAAKELDEMFKGFQETARKAKPSPPVLGRTSLPSSQKSPGQMTRQERTAYVAEHLRALNEGA